MSTKIKSNRWLMIVLMLLSASVFAQQQFSSLQDLMTYVAPKSITLQSADLRVVQAKQARLSALLAVPDIQATLSGSFTHNTKLAVSVFPAEIFGGAAGTYREVRTGIPYNTNATQYVDIKLVNIEGWQNLRLAKLNIEMKEVSVQQSKKSLEENMASLYYSIIQLQEQVKLTEQFVANADTVLRMVTNRYREGIAKQQDVNDATVNRLNQQNNKEQLEFLIKQYYTSLKVACDIPDNENFVLTETLLTAQETVAENPTVNNLNLTYNVLQEEYAKHNFRKTNASFYPSLSAVAGNAYNLFNSEYKPLQGNWINNNYVGVKINFTLPTATMLKNRNVAKYDYLLSVKNREQAQIQAQLGVSQLSHEWSKAKAQWEKYQAMASLREDTYRRNKNMYDEKLISLDNLITSFNQYVTAQYNAVAGKAAVQLANAKIAINNKTYSHE